MTVHGVADLQTPAYVTGLVCGVPVYYDPAFAQSVYPHSMARVS